MALKPCLIVTLLLEILWKTCKNADRVKLSLLRPGSQKKGISEEIPRKEKLSGRGKLEDGTNFGRVMQKGRKFKRRPPFQVYNPLLGLFTLEIGTEGQQRAVMNWKILNSHNLKMHQKVMKVAMTTQKHGQIPHQTIQSQIKKRMMWITRRFYKIQLRLKKQAMKG